MCQGPGEASAAAAAALSPKDNKQQQQQQQQRTPRRKDPAVIAAKEVLGRQVAVWSDKTMEWGKAAIARYNPENNNHLVRFLEREEGSVKHEERWVNLAKTRFQWLSDPSPTAAPNPTHAGCPKGDDAVGYIVRIFWPGMTKWYQGKVEAYDAVTKRHTVKYRDGDVQEYLLRHEAVVFLEKVGVSTRKDRTKGSAEKSRDRIPKDGGKKNNAKEDGGAVAAGSKRGRSSSVEGEGQQQQQAAAGGHRRAAVRANAPTPALSKKPRKSGSGGGGGGGTRAASATTGSSGAEDDDDDEEEEEEGEEGGEQRGAGEEGSSSGSESDDDQDDMEEDDDDDVELLDDVDEEESEDLSDSEGGRHKGKRGRPPGSRATARNRQGRPTPSSARRRSVPMPDGTPRRRGRPPGSGTGRRSGRGRSARREGTAVPRMPRLDDEVLRTAGASVVGARVAVFWNDDDTYYKGKLVQFDSYHKRHKVLYDDGEEEWVAMQRVPFRYLTPRAASAGCNQTFRSAMAQLGAAQEMGAPLRRGEAWVIQGTPVPAGAALAVAAPAPQDAAGWQVSVRSPADGRWHRAEVLCHDSRRGRHYLLYEDGEDEWISLADEEVVWHGAVPQGRDGLFPGKAPGVEAPLGRAAVGWRVAVFWPGDAAFYSGEVAGWDEAGRQHEVSYDDGEEGTISLDEDRVKWILPPGVAVDHENLERLEVGGGRPRRRITVAGGDSDPDYEFEQAAAGMVAAGRGRRGGLNTRGGGGVGGGARGMKSNGYLHHSMQHHHSGWGEASMMGGDASEALPSPLGGPRPGAFGPGFFGSAAAPQQQQLQKEEYLGPPAVVRQLTRVAPFATSHGSGAGGVQLPTAIAVKIYLSSNAAADAAAAAAAAAAAGQIDPAAAVAAAAVPGQQELSISAVAQAPTQPSTSPSVPALPRSHPTAKLQARLKALDMMARRVARAEQAIVKGVPTGLPAQAVRPLRLGPPPSAARLAAAGAPGVLGPLRAPGPLRLGRPSVSQSPFLRRHSLDEEEDEDSEEEDDDEGGRRGNGGRSDDDNSGGKYGADGSYGDDGEGVGRGDGGNGVRSSSGSSDDEAEDGSDAEGEAVVSPRSPCFPRGGKFKPSAPGSGEQAGARATTPHPPATAAEAGAGGGGPPAAGVQAPEGAVPQASPSKAMPGAPNISLAGLQGGDLPAADSFSNLLALPRNVSMQLLSDPALNDNLNQAGSDFMDLA